MPVHYPSITKAHHNRKEVVIVPKAQNKQTQIDLNAQSNQEQVLTIWFCLAVFFISAINFFSCVWRLALSLSNSRIDLSSMRLFSLRSSWGVFFFPNIQLIVAVLLCRN
jgi:hypothetical protein